MKKQSKKSIKVGNAEYKAVKNYNCMSCGCNPCCCQSDNDGDDDCGNGTPKLQEINPEVIRTNAMPNYCSPEVMSVEEKKVLNSRESRNSETLPGGRFPMPDKAHAQNALARLNQAHGLTEAEKEKVRARAHRILGPGHFDPKKKPGS